MHQFVQTIGQSDGLIPFQHHTCICSIMLRDSNQQATNFPMQGLNKAFSFCIQGGCSEVVCSAATLNRFDATLSNSTVS